MDTEMRLHYIEIERSSEAARLHPQSRTRGRTCPADGALRRSGSILCPGAVVMLRKGGWVRRDAADGIESGREARMSGNHSDGGTQRGTVRVGGSAGAHCGRTERAFGLDAARACSASRSSIRGPASSKAASTCGRTCSRRTDSCTAARSLPSPTRRAATALPRICRTARSGFTTIELKSNFLGTATEGGIACRARLVARRPHDAGLGRRSDGGGDGRCHRALPLHADGASTRGRNFRLAR